MTNKDLDFLSINTIRTICIDAIQKANSGHPGLPLGAAPMAYVLYQDFLHHNPADPTWSNRDRFVLSGGHGSSLLYAMLHLTGYDLPLEELKRFRQWNSKTPGHPEFGWTPGVEATTGPLGQGSANAVGMALAERMLAARYNRPGFSIVDHFTYAIVTDGDLMEGINAEAASLAGHLKLGKLIYLYDSNDISLDGPTSLAYTEDYAARYRAYGWHVEVVEDGNSDLDGLRKALRKAQSETERPSMIVVRTTIGFGSPNKAGSAKSHGSPLGEEEVRLTKRALGWPEDAQFLVPDAVRTHMGQAREEGRRSHEAWNKLFAQYAQAYPSLAEEWNTSVGGALPDGWDKTLPVFQVGQSVATRKAGGDALNAIADQVPFLCGGDADLSGSTQTRIKSSVSFTQQHPEGRNIHFGVREHAMAAIANGIAYHGGLRTFCSTFFVFCDYMRPSIRLAAMNHLPVVYVLTHDSIGVGEDGPTHQPVEHLMAMRLIPNLHVVRPADAQETVQAWKYAMTRVTGPTALVLTRQNLPVLEGSACSLEHISKGAYVLRQASGQPKAVLLATGSEVSMAVAAAAKLEEVGIPVQVVSMPCIEAFKKQSIEYRNQVLPPNLKARVSVEAGVTTGWREWTGDQGQAVGLDRYGASAPAELLFQEFGLTVDAVVEAVKATIARCEAQGQ